MTKRQANRRARKLFGPAAFVYVGAGGWPCFVSDGSKSGNYFVVVGTGDDWEKAIQDATRKSPLGPIERLLRHTVQASRIRK